MLLILVPPAHLHAIAHGVIPHLTLTGKRKMTFEILRADNNWVQIIQKLDQFQVYRTFQIQLSYLRILF